MVRSPAGVALRGPLRIVGFSRELVDPVDMPAIFDGLAVGPVQAALPIFKAHGSLLG